MKSIQFLTYTEEDRIAFITFNRPDKHNAINDSLIAELKDVISQVEKSPHVKLVVLKAKAKDFCLGADIDYLKKLQKFNLEENLLDSSALAQIYLKIYRSSKIFVAQIEGDAISEGCGLASVCDFAFAVAEARFGYAEVQMGLVPAIAMIFLLRKIGETRTKEMMLSGNLIDARKAARYNLITEVIPTDEIEDYVLDFAKKIVERNSAMAMYLTKKMMADIQEFPIENAVKFAAKMNAHARVTEDSKKGIAAFLNEQQVKW